MFVSGASSSLNNQQTSSNYRLSNSEFQQLGKDLTAGNLSSAQSDFAALQQVFMQPATTSSSLNSTPLAQEFQQLSSDLKSGDLAAAQKDYTTIQNELQSQFKLHTHYIQHIKDGGTENLLNDLNQGAQTNSSALQGNGTAVQQTYAVLAQQLQQFALGDASGVAGISAASTPISFMA